MCILKSYKSEKCGLDLVMGQALAELGASCLPEVLWELLCWY